MKLKIKKYSIDEVLLQSSIYIFFTITILSTSFYYKYFIDTYKIFLLISVALLFIREIFSVYNLKTILSMILLSILLFILLPVSNGVSQWVFPIGLVFIYFLRDVSFEKLSKSIIFLSLLVLIFVIISSKFGIIENYSVISSGRLRYFIGFRYALFSSTIMTNITILWCNLKKDRIKFIEIIFLLFANYWIFLNTDSRLTFYTTIVVLFVTIIYKHSQLLFKFLEKFSFFLIPSYIYSFLISFYLSYYYDPSVEWQHHLNDILGTRLYLGNKSLEYYGFSFVGQSITWVGSGLDAYGNKSTLSYNYVDSLYIQILQKYGIIFTCLVLIILTILLYKLHRDRQFFLILMLSITAFHGIIDDLILYLHYNSLWLLTGSIIYKDYRYLEDNSISNSKALTRTAKIKILNLS
ncbi:hypothetical protein ACTGWZ_06915 [Streptococcus suis]